MGSKKVTPQAVLKAFAEIANLYIHGEFRRTGKKYIILQAMMLDPISVHI